MELLFFLLSLGGIAALSGILEDEGSAQDTGGDDERDIDVTAIEYAPGESLHPILLLNDAAVQAQESDLHLSTYDLSEVETDADRIAILFDEDFTIEEQSNLHIERNDAGDILVQSGSDTVALQGMTDLPDGLLEIHIVRSGFDDDGVLQPDEIQQSFESVSVDFGAESAEVFTVEDPTLDLAVVNGGGGDDVLSVTGTTTLRAELGTGNDLVDLSADAAPLDAENNEIREYTDNEYGFWDPDGESGGQYIYDYTQIGTGEGNDSVLLGNHTAVVFTGEGDDSISATGDAVAYIDAGTGDDLVDLRADTVGGNDHFAIGGAGNDQFEGSAGEDTYFGADNSIGDGSSDSVSGHGGDDVLYGSAGADVIEGGAGDDLIGGVRDLHEYSIDVTDYADGAADTMAGGAGDDTIIGDAYDVMSGSEGADQFSTYWRPNDSDSATIVTDFDPAEDQLEITIHFDDIQTTPSHWEDDEDWEAGIHPDLVDVGSDTHVVFEGQTLAVLQGVNGVPASAISGQVFLPYNRW
ncbi:hypothetical protein TG4357_00263 [Thalassovita gelatinovora]|uniref:Hemolysin, chromosomal n=1 Tax=Thalassovita gelatinovora TaxID=53501 RepID=A0A0P1F5I9_THAGE|nr:calcium-binding protein [Thalassovita gelatinovora]QIZ79392.1 calcium-binding protein [Thalassovita gelatinovora]CUH62715.1 hypothetical protein TG4357_00263 [Thalassovita gelatinovora]SEQ08981.1 hypothetical protein SAMN04488043_103163 [Thalassovita gelatinovora]